MLTCNVPHDSWDVLASISGLFNQFEYRDFVTALETHCEVHGKARLTLDVGQARASSGNFFWQDIQYALRYLTESSRVAVIGQSSHRAKFDQIVDPFVSCELAFFEWGDLASACAWLAPEQTAQVPSFQH